MKVQFNYYKPKKQKKLMAKLTKSEQRKQDKFQGEKDRKAGLVAQHPDNGYYMQGYNKKETDKKVRRANGSVASAEALAYSLSA